MPNSTLSNLSISSSLTCNYWARNGAITPGFISSFISGLISGCLVSAVFLPSSAIATQTQGEETVETIILASEVEPAATSTIERTTEWPDATSIKDSFLQGCIGEEPTAFLERRTKRNFCQCAFSAYSSRLSPYQFVQVNSLASQIGEDGISLVSLMMTNEMKACSEETGFEFEQ